MLDEKLKNNLSQLWRCSFIGFQWGNKQTWRPIYVQYLLMQYLYCNTKTPFKTHLLDWRHSTPYWVHLIYCKLDFSQNNAIVRPLCTKINETKKKQCYAIKSMQNNHENIRKVPHRPAHKGLGTRLVLAKRGSNESAWHDEDTTDHQSRACVAVVRLVAAVHLAINRTVSADRKVSSIARSCATFQV